jgi:hypothetical protein
MSVHWHSAIAVLNPLQVSIKRFDMRATSHHVIAHATNVGARAPLCDIAIAVFVVARPPHVVVLMVAYHCDALLHERRPHHCPACQHQNVLIFVEGRLFRLDDKLLVSFEHGGCSGDKDGPVEDDVLLPVDGRREHGLGC